MTPSSADIIVYWGFGEVVDPDVRKPLVIPAWCDPQARNYRLSWADILIGVLIVDHERFVFATPKAVVINAPRPESALEWLRGKAFGMIPRFDLATPHGTFRLYLSRPSTSAPLFGEHAAVDTSEKVAQAGDALGSLVGIFSQAGSVFQIADMVKQAIEAGADYKEVRQGHAAARALRARLEPPAQEH